MKRKKIKPGGICGVFGPTGFFFDHGRDKTRLTPRLGTDFVIAARALLNDAIRSDLVNLQGFAFRQHPDIPVEGERLEKLSYVVNGQIRKILG